MAKLKGTSMQGLFARAIFLTAQEKFAEESFYMKKLKFQTLQSLLGSCAHYSARVFDDEKQGYTRLQLELQDILQVDLDNLGVIEQLLGDTICLESQDSLKVEEANSSFDRKKMLKFVERC